MPDTHSERPTDIGPRVTPDAIPDAPVPSQSSQSRALPQHDWILLPLIAAITIAIIAGGAKVITEREFSHSKSFLSACIRDTGAESGLRGIPNSVCNEKIPEGKPVEYRFNSCGDRSTIDCDAKRDGSLRIVLIGSSYAMGLRVPAEDSFAERLGPELLRRTGRQVKIYNAAMYGTGGTPHSLANRISEFMALKPDLILWVMGSWEINPTEGPVVQSKNNGGSSHWSALLRSFDQSLVAGYLRHFLYQSQSLYTSAYLRGSPEAVLLTAIPTAEESERMRLFGVDAATILDRANAAGVPVVATFLPNRAESSLVSNGNWPAGIDPYRLDNDLRVAVASKGATFVDILPAFGSVSNPERLYFPLDTHLDSRGHWIVTGILANALTSGAVPALSRQKDSYLKNGQSN